jgi:hypothetical protein
MRPSSSPDLDRSLLNLCRTYPITIGEAIKEFENDTTTKAAIMGGIGWLLKFGLLELQALESKVDHGD